jgi:hypothetical protein
MQFHGISKKKLIIFHEIIIISFFLAIYLPQPIWVLPAKIWGFWARWFGRKRDPNPKNKRFFKNNNNKAKCRPCEALRSRGLKNIRILTDSSAWNNMVMLSWCRSCGFSKHGRNAFIGILKHLKVLLVHPTGMRKDQLMHRTDCCHQNNDMMKGLMNSNAI